MIRAPIAALAAGAAFIAAAAPAQEDSATLWRLFVADHDSGRITALDLDALENRWSFDVGGASRLYPDDFPVSKTGTLLGGAAVQIFVGDYGGTDLVVIDPEAEPHFSRVEFPFRHVDFVLDPAKPQYAYVLTEDGTLHRLDILSLERISQASVTAPYSMDGHWRDPRPRLAVAGDEIVLTDPNAGLVRVIDAESLEELRRIEIEGKPYNVLAIGGSGHVH